MTVVRAGDVAEQIRGVTYSKADARQTLSNGYVPIIGASQIADAGLSSHDVVYVSERLVSKSQFLRPGDVVIATSSGSLKVVGKAALVPPGFPRAAFGAFCKVMRPGPGIDHRYFAHYFRTDGYRRLVSSLAAGANINNLRTSDLDNLEIPMPELSDQHRISEVLDCADNLASRRRAILVSLEALRQSVLIEFFGDPRSWLARWPMGTIGDLADSVQYGSSSKAGTDGRWPMLRMGNVTDDGRLDLSDLKHIDLSPADEAKYTVRRGDVLFNRTNSAEKVGKTCVVTTDRPMAIAGYLVRVRVKPEHRPEFLSGYLNSAHGKATLRGMAKAIVNQANINASEMQTIPIALPPEAVQEDYAQRVRDIERLRARALDAQAAEASLFASLQARAFSGTL